MFLFPPLTKKEKKKQIWIQIKLNFTEPQCPGLDPKLGLLLEWSFVYSLYM